MADEPTGIPGVLAQMDALAHRLPPELAPHRAFLDTYRRTTVAVGNVVDHGQFEDPDWVACWDVTFAGIYIRALAARLDDGPVSRPWRLTFAARPDLGELRHVLLGVNAHINFDLPQSLLEAISDDDFADPTVLARRQRDHERVDAVLSGRVAAEDAEISSRSTVHLLDRALRPLNRAGSKRFLRESRQKVWHNTLQLHEARLLGPEVYAVRLAELELLSAARISDLVAPGQVLLRLAVSGFGVTLPPPA